MLHFVSDLDGDVDERADAEDSRDDEEELLNRARKDHRTNVFVRRSWTVSLELSMDVRGVGGGQRGYTTVPCALEEHVERFTYDYNGES